MPTTRGRGSTRVTSLSRDKASAESVTRAAGSPGGIGSVTDETPGGTSTSRARTLAPPAEISRCRRSRASESLASVSDTVPRPSSGTMDRSAPMMPTFASGVPTAAQSAPSTTALPRCTGGRSLTIITRPSCPASSRASRIPSASEWLGAAGFQASSAARASIAYAAGPAITDGRSPLVTIDTRAALPSRSSSRSTRATARSRALSPRGSMAPIDAESSSSTTRCAAAPADDRRAPATIKASASAARHSRTRLVVIGSFAIRPPPSGVCRANRQRNNPATRRTGKRRRKR